MNYWHPWQLKKSKSWKPFWSYQLNSSANPAHLSQDWTKLAVLFSWYCSIMAPRILIFSIAIDADNSFYVKFIATFAPIFFGYIISILAIVVSKKKKRHTQTGLQAKLSQQANVSTEITWMEPKVKTILHGAKLAIKQIDFMQKLANMLGRA